MNWPEFLHVVIEDGIAGAKDDYCNSDRAMHLEGSLKGFEECRGKSPAELAALMMEALVKTSKPETMEADDYWYWRCREAEIEWVCCVASAALRAEIPGARVTARAVLKAAEVLAKGDGCLVVEGR